MLAGQHRLVAQPGITVEFRATRRGHLFRHVAEYENDLVAYRHARVGIVAFAGFSRNGETVAGKDHLAFHGRVGREGERAEIALDRERTRDIVSQEDELIGIRPHANARRELEALELPGGWARGGGL